MSNSYESHSDDPAVDSTLQCAGCKHRLLAAQYPPGVACPRCRDKRRRLPDGTLLPRRSLLPWIILIDLLVTALLVVALLYYFVWREPPVPPPTVEPAPGPTVNAPAAAPARAAGVSRVPFALVDPARISISVPSYSDATAIPTITGDDLLPEDEHYEPIEFVGPPPHQRENSEDVLASPQQPWTLHALIHGDLHDTFDERVLNSERWATLAHESPDPCQSYFMLNRGQLLLGATEGRPQGPEHVIWTHEIEGDFDASIDYRWIVSPRDGQCGMYLECVDGDGEILGFVDITAWGTDAESRKIIFRSEGDRGAVSSVPCPGEGRIRVSRRGSLLAASLWNDGWQGIGDAACSSTPMYLRLAGYSSSSCPRYAIALDDLEVNHRSESVARLVPRDPSQPDAMAFRDTEEHGKVSTPGRDTGVVSIREAPIASGSPGKAHTSLPHAMAALPTGRIAAEFRNPSGQDLMVGLRKREEGLDLRLPAGASKRAMIPSGTYTMMVRPIGSPGPYFASDVISIPAGASTVTFVIASGTP